MAEDRNLYATINELLIRCSCCGELISDIGSKVDGIYVCSPCLSETTLT